jgi:glutamate-5-semialdehyde dehydrogenase
MLERLALTPARIDGMIVGLRQVASLPDPVGAIRDMSYRPSASRSARCACRWVIGIIYESRPNVTIDAASLCLKSGNATILRGGSEAIHSNRAIAAASSAVWPRPNCRRPWCKWSKPPTVPPWAH